MSLQQSEEPAQEQPKRQPVPLQVRQLRSFVETRADNLVVVAGALIPLGVVLLLVGALLAGGAWVSAVGAAVLGTGLTILTSTLTSAKAVREQYSKEANIERKRTIYGPLHAELKRLREMLTAAEAGTEPWPLWIAGTGKQFPEAIFDPSYTVPTLALWPAFKADYRIESFQEHTRQLLDEVHRLAAEYDDVMMAAQATMITILTPYVTALVKEARTAGAQGEVPADFMWVKRVNEQETAEERGRMWSGAWIASWPIHQQPATLGWLLAGNTEKAAQTIRVPMIVDQDAVPSSAQLERVFAAALREFESHPVSDAVDRVAIDLITSLHEAEGVLATGLQYIRDRYEGGQPPV